MFRFRLSVVVMLVLLAITFTPALAQTKSDKVTSVYKTLLQLPDGSLQLPSGQIIGKQMTAEELAEVQVGSTQIVTDDRGGKFPTRMVAASSAAGTALNTKSFLLALPNFGVVVLAQALGDGREITSLRLVATGLYGVSWFTALTDGKIIGYGSGTLYRFQMPTTSNPTYDIARMTINFADSPVVVGKWLFGRELASEAPIFAARLDGNTLTSSFNGKTFDCSTRSLFTDGSMLYVFTGCGEVIRFQVNDNGLVGQGIRIAEGLANYPISHMTIVRGKVVAFANPVYGPPSIPDGPSTIEQPAKLYAIASGMLKEIMLPAEVALADYINFMVSAGGDQILIGVNASQEYGSNGTQLQLIELDPMTTKVIKVNFNFKPFWLNLDFVNWALVQ